MNSEAAELLRDVAADVEAKGGPAAHRAHALQHLRLKTVIKESHGSPIDSLCFNHAQPGAGNLFATVGKNQATVYDDSHLGDYTSVLVQFYNNETQYHKGGDLSACAWVNMEGLSPHPHGDACLAVAGGDPAISIISVVESRVVALLKGHEPHEVVELAGCPGVPGLLLSLGRDGGVRLWDVANHECLASLDTDAFCAALHPEGKYFVTAHKGGKLARWDLALETHPVKRSEQQVEEGRPGSRLALSAPPGRGALALAGLPSDAADCLRLLPGERLAVKTPDGRISVACLASGKLLTSFRIPGGKPVSLAPSHRSRCCFSTSADGAYVVAGSSASPEVFVFDAASGSRLARLSAVRVNGPVRACGMSEDGRHVLGVLGNGFVFRWEYPVPSSSSPDGDEEEEEEDEEDGEGGDGDEEEEGEQPAAAARAGSRRGSEADDERAVAGPGSCAVAAAGGAAVASDPQAVQAAAVAALAAVLGNGCVADGMGANGHGASGAGGGGDDDDSPNKKSRTQ